MNNRNQRRAKIRKTIKGTQNRPRLVVFRSSRFFYAQLVNDDQGTTITSINKAADPQSAGKELAEAAKKAKISSVVFDRAGYKYHGIVKKFADAARQAGLKF